jgi:hypothetical protein
MGVVDVDVKVTCETDDDSVEGKEGIEVVAGVEAGVLAVVGSKFPLPLLVELAPEKYDNLDWLEPATWAGVIVVG